MSFFSELKRRNIFRVAVLYIIAGWVVLQASDVLADVLPVPAWTGSFVFLLLLLAFPLVVIFSWVYEITPEGIKLEKEIKPDESISHETGRRLNILIGSVAALAIVVVAIDRFVPEEVTAIDQAATTASSEPIAAITQTADNSIAVLPFVDMSVNGDQAYFSDGLAEELLNLLAKLPELKVASRTSSFSFRNKPLDMPSIANQLGVRYVLEGSVRKQGEKIRITAQLIDAQTNFHKWSETYERKQDDIFAIQDDIARNVVTSLHLMLSNQSENILAQRGTETIQAFEAYLQGRNYLRQPVSDETLNAAERFFKQALQIDPRYADAHAGICNTHLERYEHTSDIGAFEQAEQACNRVLTLSPDAPAALIALGRLYRLSGQYDRAAQNYRSAIHIDSGAAEAYDGLARTFEIQNRVEEAREAHQQAIDIQPGFWRGYMSMGSFLFRIGRSDEAIDYMRTAVELSPGNPRALNSLGTVLYMTGNFEDARTAWYRSLQIDPTPIAYSNLGTASFLLQDFEQAAAMYGRAIELTPDDHQLWGALADAYRFMAGQDHLAVANYEKAITLVEEFLDLNSDDAYTLAMLAHYLANTDKPDVASSYLAQARLLSPDNMYVHYYAALIAVKIGDVDGAISASKRAIENGYPSQFLLADAGMAPVIDNPEFRELLGERSQ
ncbi:MAG: tetratricopeptide repeat protein [Gammaproteobacteria bacterium]|nr:tetratricopeptide repeat protein [Gammaproteobacteria bacterium]